MFYTKFDDAKFEKLFLWKEFPLKINKIKLLANRHFTSESQVSNI